MNGSVSIHATTKPALPAALTFGGSMDLLAEQLETSRDMDFLHEIGHRLAAADPIESIMDRVLDFIADLVRCDSCLVYIAQGEKLVLRASRNPHSDLLNRLGLQMGEGITGWVAEHRQTVAIARHAWTDARFLMFNDLPEDRFEAFLSVPILCRSRVVGVINLQHRQPHHHTEREIRVITTIGFLVGAELELARIESERMEMQRQLETRKIMERAKGIIQRQLQVDEENAYLTLQKLSRQKRRPIREIAEAIILGEELRATPA
ncbi:uroporphyrinogen-III synthase [Granulicella rosea]|uniref:Uroporphyrinogen-III synthase n=2 Tax=Granulicella rosea TaxID=474952 RepID=A0A239K9X3_9BACT|nr:uroporphyrinogen-III synthase [Granulicella rosea]